MCDILVKNGTRRYDTRLGLYESIWLSLSRERGGDEEEGVCQEELTKTNVELEKKLMEFEARFGKGG